MRDFRFLTKPSYENSHALIIGVNEYKNAPPLSYAVSDAQEIRELLVKEVGFPEQNVCYLENQDANKENINRAFLQFTLDCIGLDDRIFIFFAGHGHTRTSIRGEVGYLVPYDADMTDFSTFIRWDELTRNADLIRAKHVLFVMDACYGGLAVTRNLQPGSFRFLKDMMRRYSRQVLTAGKADEVVADAGGPLPNHSIFTGHLIEGLRGAAASEQGIITANGLMAYVYKKVATDQNSNQTPHYGYIDGDGDFIFFVPDPGEVDEEFETDQLISVAAIEDEPSEEALGEKIQRTKRLLSNDSSNIELHDYLVQEIREFLSKTSEEYFKVSDPFSQEELLERMTRYEALATDISAITACIAYWARNPHQKFLQKIVERSTDRHFESRSGLSTWIHLRWYPQILQLYYSGIAAINGGRYDSLFNIFYTEVDDSQSRDGQITFAESVNKAIMELYSADIPKKIPGHENHYVPLSEYLFKILQPILDDMFFIGGKYEKNFDEFEILFGLVIADLKKQKNQRIWGPIGRFGWNRSALDRFLANAEQQGEKWEPIRCGMFGGSYKQFSAVAEEFQQLVNRRNWF